MASWIGNYLEKNPEMAERKVLKRRLNATHFEIAPGVRRAVITGAPQNFREGGEWHAIDLALRADNSGWLGAPGARVRMRTNGETRVLGQKYEQKTVSIGVLNDGVYTPLHRLPIGRRRGRRLVREIGLFRHESILTEGGVKEELTILDTPEVVGDGLLGYLSKINGDGRIRPTRAGGFEGGDRLNLPPGNVEDVNGKRLPFERHVIEIAGKEAVFSGVPISALNGAVFPIVVDPEINVTGETADGYVRGHASTYSAARATSTDYSTSSDLFVGQALESAIPRYYVFRSFLKFDLSSIDPESTLLAATLGLTRSTTFPINKEFDVQVAHVDWSSSDPLGSGNKEGAYDGCLSAQTDVVWRNTDGAVVGEKYSSPPLDPTYMILGQDVYFGLRSSRDKAGSSPSVNGNEYIRLASANHATIVYRPELAVDYAAVFPATGSVSVPSATFGSYDTRNKLRARYRDYRLTTSVRSKK